MVRVGRATIHQLPISPDAGHNQQCSFGIERTSIVDQLDLQTDNAYDTAIFRLELTQECGDPPYALRARDAFVAGFASGE